MRRAWRWYWRTLGGYWHQMDRRTRSRFVGMMVGTLAFYMALAVVILLVPSARVPVLLGVLIILPGQSIVTALMRARRGRHKRSDSN
jgi:hypothetical protein